METQNPNPFPASPIDDPAIDDWELAWEKHKKTILAAAAAIAVAGIAIFVWWINSTLTNEAAEKLLAEATGIEGYRAVVEKYPRSNPAADALMLLAAAHREAGDLPASTAAFKEFLQKFPAHELAGGALLGVGQNQDASGDEKGAIATYQQVVTQFPDSYAAPFAAYCEAELLLRSFQREEARRSFNMVTSRYPQSAAARMAANQLSRLGAQPQQQSQPGQ
ncbi:MAG: tetratricopeptide repeat protein [Terrimicrobiaceae bacterium]